MTILQRPTVELHYTSTGAGPCVVLLHGWCDDARTWEPLIQALQGSLRCIAPDMRGHGSSKTPSDHCFSIEALTDDIAAICEREAVSPALLVGHSYGAIVGAATAQRHPHLARGLLLLDQFYDFGSLNAQMRDIEPAMRSPDQHLAFRKQFLGGLMGDIRGEPRRRLEDAISTTPTAVALALWAPLFDWSQDELAAFGDELLRPLDRLPSKVIDRERFPEYHERLQRKYPRARFDILRGGHWMHIEHADRIAAEVRRLAAEVSAG